MMKKRLAAPTILLVIIVLLLLPVAAQAAPGKSVEARLSALETQVATLQRDLAAAQATIATLQSSLSQVQANPALDLGPYVSVESGAINDLAGPNILITGANLHLRSGSGSTMTKNGLGNLVIGYNAAPELGGDPEFVPPFDPDTYRTGSHNLILGDYNRYWAYAGIVGGTQNTVGSNSAVISGSKNSADYGSAVLSGIANFVNSWSGAIVGGQGNSLRSENPGWYGQFAAILGGMGNNATGYASTVAGGQESTASGTSSSVSGGRYNLATGEWSSIGGGTGLTVPDDYGWAAGNPTP